MRIKHIIMEHNYSVDVNSGLIEDDKYYFCVRFDNSSVLNEGMAGAHLLIFGMSPEKSVGISNIRPPFVGNLVLVGSRTPLVKYAPGINSSQNKSTRSKIGYISDISSTGEITVEFEGIPNMKTTHNKENRWAPINNTYSHLEDVLLRGISDNVIADTFNLPQGILFRL